MRMRIYTCLLVILCSVLTVHSQTRKEWLEYGDAAFKMQDYSSAAFYYQKVIDPGTHGSRDFIFPYDVKTFIAPLDSTNQDSVNKAPADSAMPKTITQRIGYDYVVHQIAESYRLMRDYDNAEIWYAKASRNVSKKYPNDKMWYGAMLMTNKKYNEAQTIFESILADSTIKGSYTWVRAKIGSLGCYFALDTASFKKETVISLLDTTVNSKDASAVFASGFLDANLEMLITTARKDGKKYDPKNKEEEPYYNLDIYTIERKDQGWNKPVLVPGPINTPNQEGAPAISINKDLMYFTRWNPEDSRECAIYISRFMNGKWLEPSKLQNVNFDGYMSMQPSLNFEGTKLYFSSNKPGGRGGFDIYFIEIDEQGNSMGMPVNLGSMINTTENEISPYFHSKGSTLYFSSDGHVGVGGYDIFKTYATPDDDTLFTKPVNMKMPINSSRDDAYFIILNDQKTAYFSSDRDKCTGCEPNGGYCYKLFEVEKNPPIFTISGTVTNIETGAPIPNALVTFKDVQQNLQPFFLITNENGYYESPLPEDFDFFIKAQKNKFFGDGSSVSTKGKSESEHFIRDFKLTPIPAGEIVIEGIEYDFDKATLRPRSKAILDTLAQFLELNNQVFIEINSHTDTRGSDAYNLALSDARAKSCMDYLLAKGIDPKRLVSKGYGETVPYSFKDKGGKEIVFNDAYINSLKTPDEKENAHQRNRRTSFVVTGETKIEVKYKNKK